MLYEVITVRRLHVADDDVLDRAGDAWLHLAVALAVAAAMTQIVDQRAQIAAGVMDHLQLLALLRIQPVSPFIE